MGEVALLIGDHDVFGWICYAVVEVSHAVECCPVLPILRHRL